jgi:hypothetical protein
MGRFGSLHGKKSPVSRFLGDFMHEAQQTAGDYGTGEEMKEVLDTYEE